MYEGLQMNESDLSLLINREEILIFTEFINSNFVGFYDKDRICYYVISVDNCQDQCQKVIEKIDKIQYDLVVISEQLHCNCELDSKIELIFNAKDLLKTN